MNPSKCIVTLVISAFPLMGAPLEKLSDRPKQGELQRVFCATRDGYALLQLLNDQRLCKDLVFAKIIEANQTQPTYLADDPKYKSQNDSDLPKRPQITDFKISVIKSSPIETTRIPSQIKWNELKTYNSWHGPHYTAYQGLTEEGFDPFAHNGELAFRFDGSKKGRNQFADLLIVPDQWGSQIDSAAVWRLQNKALFDRATLTKDELAVVRAETRSNSTLIRKMAFSLLMKHNALSAEDLKTWLRSEPSLVDVAVTVQLMLAHDPRPSVVVVPAWMVTEGEQVWGGALVAATLLFTTNQAAVDSMKDWHYKQRQGKETEASDLIQLLRAAETQPGFHMLKDIGNELVRFKQIRNYPFLSAGHLVFSSSAVIDPSFLSTE